MPTRAMTTPRRPSKSSPLRRTVEASVEQILELLRARSGHDFGSYKRSTLRRRIHRRMGLRNIVTLDEICRRIAR